MPEYLTGRKPELKIGISDFSENKTVLQTVGKVGIKTEDARDYSLYVVGPTNIDGDFFTSGITTLASNGGITTTGGDLYVGGDFTVSGTVNVENLDVNNATIDNLQNTNLNTSGIGTIENLDATTATIDYLSGIDIFLTGIITASQLSTGNFGDAINITSDSILGPSSIIIDPSPIGNNFGSVRIKGDLYVDGTEFIVNSSIIDLADFNVGIATTVSSNILLDGAGIGIGSTNIRKYFYYNYSSDSLKSSENFDLGTNKVYNIDGSSVLSSTTLGAGVTYSSLQNLGTLNSLIVSGITTLSENGGITTTGGDLYVGGDLYIKDDLFFDEFVARNATITGLTSTQNLIVSGISTFNGNVDIDASLNVDTDVYVTGVSTFVDYIDANGGAYIDNIQIGITDDNEIDTTIGNLVIDSAEGTVTIDDQLIVTGISTFNGSVDIDASLNVDTDVYVTGVSTFVGILTNQSTIFANQLSVSGITTLASNGGITTTGGDLYVGGDLHVNEDIFINDINSQNINVSGIGTIETLDTTTGTIDYLSGINLNYSGIGTITTLNSTNGTITNLTGTAGTITTLNSTNGTITNLTGTAGTITTLNSTNGTITTLNSTNGTITNLTGTAGTITTLNSTNGTITNLTGTAGTITTLNSTNANIGYLNNTNIYSSGIITANQFSTGPFSSAINITSDTITGPSTIIIDPSSIGDNTGSVRIKGDLYVDGTEFIVGSTTIELADFNVGIATTVGTNLLLDGAGIGIGSINIRKTLTYDYSSDSLKSSENFDLSFGKVYKINEAEVLSATQLTIPNIYSSGIGTIETLDTTNGSIDYLTNTNLNTSGIGTITTLNSTNGTITNLTGTAGTITTFNSTNGTITNLTGTAGTITTLNSTNGTITTLNSTNGNITTLNSTNGTITNLTGTAGTITTFNSTNGTITNLTGTAGTITTFNSTNGTITNLTGTAGTITTLNSTNGFIDYLTNTNLNTSGIGTIVNLDSTNATIDYLTNTNLNTSGIGTIETLDTTNGSIDYLTNTNLNTSGIGTIVNLDSTNGTITNLIGTAATITSLFADELEVTNNVHIGGNLIVDGDQIIANVVELQIEDKNIVIGYTTTSEPSDITANSGGIAIASTEGNPLISFSGITTLPDTYKQILWTKSQSNNDGWVYNYSVGIGITDLLGVFQVDTNSSTFIVDNFGSVGIGTTNPQTKLQVGGVIGFNDTNIKIGDNTTSASLTSGVSNIFIGAGAGNSSTTGSYNSFFGKNSGYYNTSGNCNIFFGNYSGYANNSGSYNNSFGLCAGYYNTSGNCNNFFGNYSGFFNTTGSHNNFFGRQSGNVNETGSYNNFFGNYVGIYTNSSYKNIFGTGLDNTYAFDAPNDKDKQFAVGLNTTGTNEYWLVGNEQLNIGIGATDPQTKLEVNGVIGFTDENILIGKNDTGASITTGFKNIFIGTGVGNSNTIGNYNNFFGSFSGYCNSIGSYNSFFGVNSGYYNSTGSFNNFFGNYSGEANTTGNKNNFFGTGSGLENETGSYNNFFGNYVGIHTNTSYRNIFGIGLDDNYVFDAPNNKDKQFAVGLNTTGTNEYWLVGNENFNIGIGTTNPTQKLHVGGNVAIAQSIFDSSGSSGINQYVLTSTPQGILWQAVTSIDGVTGINVATTSDNLSFNIPFVPVGLGTTATNYVAPSDLTYNPFTNNLGIGTTNPTSKLWVNGDAYFTGIVTAFDIDTPSDINLKTNVQTISDPLEKVLQIRGVTFDWKETNRSSAGVIAQEVEKVLPELVGNNEPKTVNYNGLIGLLIEAIKDQQDQINELKNEIDKLKV